MSIAVIYGGTRENGNTETLTELAVKGLNTETIFLKDYHIQPITDLRHSESGFQKVDDDYNKVIDRMLPHDTVIFATPIYWYSMSGILKNFIDRWSQTMRDSQYLDFKTTMSGKKAYVIAVGGDTPIIKGLPLIQQFQYIFAFMGISFEGYILGKGSKPGDILNDKKALLQADQLNAILKKY
ncbi:flavodoxin family protein [Bacillaceae bacterium Marseille-Q3522]|nr:flavodoxin family protein [Bacillaceae bacterium Marseille-Q3522]